MEPAEPYVESAGFEELYLREFPALRAVAVAMAGDADSEDLVQDAMFKALVNWRRVRMLQSPGGWCHRVLLNRCRGLWRRNAVERRHKMRFVERSTADIATILDVPEGTVRSDLARARVVLAEELRDGR